MSNLYDKITLDNQVRFIETFVVSISLKAIGFAKNTKNLLIQLLKTV
jgi:hypothetical protein